MWEARSRREPRPVERYMFAVLDAHVAELDAA